MNNPTTICEALVALPPAVEVEEVTFTLAIFVNYSRTDIRVCYGLDAQQANPKAPRYNTKDRNWNNPYLAAITDKNWGTNDDYYGCDFLQLYENIENDEELLDALIAMRVWLVEKGIITDSQQKLSQ